MCTHTLLCYVRMYVYMCMSQTIITSLKYPTAEQIGMWPGQRDEKQIPVLSWYLLWSSRMSITSHTYPETLRNQSDKLQNPRIEFTGQFRQTKKKMGVKTMVSLSLKSIQSRQIWSKSPALLSLYAFAPLNRPLSIMVVWHEVRTAYPWISMDIRGGVGRSKPF